MPMLAFCCCCGLLWLVAVVCCGWLLLVAVAGFCCFIFVIRQNNMVFIYGYAYIFIVPSSLSCCPELVSDSQSSFRLALFSWATQVRARLTLGKYICLGLGIIIYIYDDMLIYLQSLLLLYCAAILLTLILSLCLRSSPLLPSQTASLATLPSLIARPVPILSQNVMPIFLTSVITSTAQKTNNASQIKREPPYQILVTIMGYIFANCSFCSR